MPRILIVDDDEAVCRAARIVLEAKGFDVVTVGNGVSGVEAIKTAAFDVAIVDLFMPVMDGLKTTEAIRKVNSTLPIIAASGFMFGNAVSTPSMPNFDTLASEAGATATLYKPFRPAELLRAIQKALGVPA